MQSGLAGKGGSEVGRGNRSLPTAVFRVVRARSAWDEEPEKVSRPLRAARRRATLRVQGAPGRVSGRRGGGVRHGIGHGRRGPPGMGCDPSAVAGLPRGLATTSRRGRRRVPESRRFGPKRDGISRTACGRYAHGIAGGEMVLRMERLRCCATRPLREGGEPMLGYEEKMERLELIDAVADAGGAGQGPGPAARVPGARRPAGPARRRGDPGPEVDKREVRRAHRGRRAHPGGRRTRSFMPRGKSLLSTPPVEKERSALGGEAVALLAPPLRFWQAPGIGAPLISLAR